MEELSDDNSGGSPNSGSSSVDSNDLDKQYKTDCSDLSEYDRDPLNYAVDLAGIDSAAVEKLRTELRANTFSCSSVPKIFKFLWPKYETLKNHYGDIVDVEHKMHLADILSVLAFTMPSDGERESLKYRLLGSEDDIGSWGQAYVRNLAVECVQERAKRKRERASYRDLMELVRQIVLVLLKHDEVPEAVELLKEMEGLNLLINLVDDTNFKQTCLYLKAARYLPDTNSNPLLDIAYSLYLKYKEYLDALQIALFLKEPWRVTKVCTYCDDLLLKRQLCFILARHGFTFELDDKMDDGDRLMLLPILTNTKLSEGYSTLARAIEPKIPWQVYKAHSLHGRASPDASVDSARKNLASTFANAFFHAGFGQDMLMMVPSASSSGSGNWVFKNKDYGRVSAAASLGVISLWDVDSGRAQMEEYVHSNDNHVIAGGLLGVGIANCSVKHDSDAVLTLLCKYVDNQDASIRIGAIMGLGIAFAGSQNIQILSMLSPILRDIKAPLDVIAFTALCLGFISVSSCNKEVAGAIKHALMALSESDMQNPCFRFLPLGLGLLYLGKQDSVEDTKILEISNEKLRKYCHMIVISCAYAGTGNFLKVEKLVEKGETLQGPAVLGIAMAAMADTSGLERAMSSLQDLLECREPSILRALPLAIGLLYISNPKVTVIDILSRFSKVKNHGVAMPAVIALGLVGAGTCNAQIEDILGDLSRKYDEVRIAEGLLRLGKGLLTLSPYHSDCFLLNRTAFAGLITMLHACLDMRSTMLGDYHYVLYFLVLAMQPRMLLTVDENLKSVSVPVSVVRAADGEASQPPEEHSTPVLLATGDRAQLATDEYIPLTNILEGFVVLKKKASDL